MSVEGKLPDDHPMMVAWASHKTTETHANDMRWATVWAHTEGALWSAFVAGWTASRAAIAKAKGDGE